MGILDVGAYEKLASKALHYRHIRSDLISSNIANIDTPFYKAKDISFEQALALEAQKLEAVKSPTLTLAKTDLAHLSPLPTDENAFDRATIFMRPNHAQRNDGNSVDLDIETTQMSKNAVMINALSNALKKRISLMKTVIDSTSRV